MQDVVECKADCCPSRSRGAFVPPPSRAYVAPVIDSVRLPRSSRVYVAFLAPHERSTKPSFLDSVRRHRSFLGSVRRLPRSLESVTTPLILETVRRPSLPESVHGPPSSRAYDVFAPSTHRQGRIITEEFGERAVCGEGRDER